MKVLVACEYSGRVRDAFTTRGHDATSCDLMPTESPGKHVQGDVTALLAQDWDLVIAFPPCTHLSCIGVRYWPRWQADGTQARAVAFFRQFTQLEHVPRVAIENPAGIMTTLYRKPDQYVQPWWFGDPWTKRTGLWLKGLPLLVADNPVESQGSWVGSQRTSRGGDRSGPLSREGSVTAGRKRDGGIERSRARQTTFPGIARAMSQQWG